MRYVDNDRFMTIANMTVGVLRYQRKQTSKEDTSTRRCRSREQQAAGAAIFDYIADLRECGPGPAGMYCSLPASHILTRADQIIQRPSLSHHADAKPMASISCSATISIIPAPHDHL